MATKYTFVYTRISADQQGRAEGVQAQERWGREYAAGTWPGVPVRVFTDNDLSAAKDDVVRPAFEEMREAIRRGECAHLWSVEQSRLARIEYVWFSLVADLIKADVGDLHTKRDGIIRLDDVVGGIKAVLSADEVRKLRKRLLDKKAELARQGRPGGVASFGYRQRIYTPAEQKRLEAWQEARHQAKIRYADMRRWKEDNPRPGRREASSRRPGPGVRRDHPRAGGDHQAGRRAHPQRLEPDERRHVAQPVRYQGEARRPVRPHHGRRFPDGPVCRRLPRAPG